MTESKRIVKPAKYVGSVPRYVVRKAVRAALGQRYDMAPIKQEGKLVCPVCDSTQHLNWCRFESHD